MSRWFEITVDTNNGNSSCLSTGEHDLASAIATAIRESSYFAVECGYSPSFTIIDQCEECYGEGAINRRSGKTARSRMRRIACPTCKGKQSSVVVVDNVPFQFHSNCGAQHEGKLANVCPQAIHTY